MAKLVLVKNLLRLTTMAVLSIVILTDMTYSI